MTDILNLIHQITANGDSGRLEILAGAIQGELSFADGKLIDARLGHLTGFRAANAISAMRDARFSFDPTFAPLGSSSITASERVVLKQFFGIEAASEYLEPVMDWPEAEAAALPDEVEEVTIVQSEAPGAAIPITATPAARFSYRTALVFAVLAMALMAAAAIFIDRFHASGSPGVVASVESTSRPAEAPAPAPVEQAKKPVNNTIRDLSGKWSVVNSVDSSGYRSFKNMKIGFDLSINQTGSTFTGKGRKVSENGHSLPANSRTPIQLKGSIKGDRIEATFFEKGTARKSSGRFVWRLDKSGRGLTGNFATTAAHSSGKSAATKSL